MQENSKYDKLQKSFINLDILYRKLKQKNSYLNNFVKEKQILVNN